MLDTSSDLKCGRPKRCNHLGRSESPSDGLPDRQYETEKEADSDGGI